MRAVITDLWGEIELGLKVSLAIIQNVIRALTRQNKAIFPDSLVKS